MAEHRFPVGDDGVVLIVWDAATVDPLVETPAAWLVAGPPPEGQFHPFIKNPNGPNRGEYCFCVAMGEGAATELVDLAEAVSGALACLKGVGRG